MEMQKVTVMLESTVVSVDGRSWGFCFQYPFFRASGTSSYATTMMLPLKMRLDVVSRNPQKTAPVKHTELDTHMLEQTLAGYRENTNPQLYLKKHCKIT